MTEEPAWGFREDATGTHAIAKLEDGRAMGVVLTERQLKIGGEPTLSSGYSPMHQEGAIVLGTGGTTATPRSARFSKA